MNADRPSQATGDETVTIVVVPRDRFSSVEGCARSIIENTTVPFKLVFLDFGYSRRTVDALRQICAGVPCDIVACGRTIPMDAFRRYLGQITTPYTCWVDNDTFVTKGWLAEMVDRAERDGMKVILPLTFEREGLDIDTRRLPLRVHISHSELRKVTVGGAEYVFDYKPYRRASSEDIPAGPWMVDFFELHTFFAATDVLRQLDFPSMVVREHVDLGIQLHRLGIPIWCVPQAEVIFDNIHTRPTIEDLRFFRFRWSDKLVDQSEALFNQRWGWRFYNARFLRNWAYRRRIFAMARFAYLPHRAADILSRVMVKLFRTKPAPEFRPDPLERSVKALDGAVPQATGSAAGS